MAADRMGKGSFILEMPDAASAAGLAAGGCLFVIGSLLPDIDQKELKWAKRLGLHGFIEHRTWTHSIWPLLAMALLSWFLPIFWWLFAGYAGHLFWDSFSRAGVCWFFPFESYRSYPSGAKVKKGHNHWLYRVGKPSELVVLACIITLSLALCALAYWGRAVEVIL